MLRNYLDMPGFLKWLTGVAAGTTAAAVRLGLLVPWRSVSAARTLRTAAAVFALVAVAATLGLACILLLARHRHARQWFAGGWVTFLISVPVVGPALGLTREDVVLQTAFSGACTGIIVLYLLRSRGVLEYIQGTASETEPR